MPKSLSQLYCIKESPCGGTTMLSMRGLLCQIKQLPARGCLRQSAPRLSRIGNAEVCEEFEVSVNFILPPERNTPITLTWADCKDPQNGAAHLESPNDDQHIHFHSL